MFSIIYHVFYYLSFQDDFLNGMKNLLPPMIIAPFLSLMQQRQQLTMKKPNIADSFSQVYSFFFLCISLSLIFSISFFIYSLYFLSQINFIFFSFTSSFSFYCLLFVCLYFFLSNSHSFFSLSFSVYIFFFSLSLSISLSFSLSFSFSISPFSLSHFLSLFLVVLLYISLHIYYSIFCIYHYFLSILLSSSHSLVIL
jgi:hypothetical protein